MGLIEIQCNPAPPAFRLKAAGWTADFRYAQGQFFPEVKVCIKGLNPWAILGKGC